jgi:hypothetical protein
LYINKGSPLIQFVVVVVGYHLRIQFVKDLPIGGFGVYSWSSLFLGYFLVALRICYDNSSLLLSSKIDPFEGLFNHLGGIRPRFLSLPSSFVGLVSAQSLILFFLWFLDKGFKYFIQAIVDLVGKVFSLVESLLLGPWSS